jgi:hypothetical protein
LGLVLSFGGQDPHYLIIILSPAVLTVNSPNLAQTAASVETDVDMLNLDESDSDRQDALTTHLERINSLCLAELQSEAREVIPRNRLPSEGFWASLSTETQTADALRGCLLVYVLSKAKAVPRDFQLRACLGVLNERNTVLCSGTGSGKNYGSHSPAAFEAVRHVVAYRSIKTASTCTGEFLQNRLIGVLSLCVTQLAEFTSYGISSVIVNQDTPDHSELWKVISTAKLNLGIWLMSFCRKLQPVTISIS